MPWVNKEDLTLKEWNSLSSTQWLVEGVNYEKLQYYRDDNGQIWEYGLCTDGSLNRKMKTLEKAQNVNSLMKSFGF